MRIFLMSAGKGERLRKYTKDKPKCLLKVGSKVMLQRWMDNFREWRIHDVLINTSYKSEQVVEYLNNIDWGKMRIALSNEKELLGTARTLYRNRKFVKGEHYFGVVYVDVWTTFDMRKMINYHKKRPCMVTLALHEPRNLKGKGVAVVKDGLVVDFEEKPRSPKSRYV